MLEIRTCWNCGEVCTMRPNEAVYCQCGHRADLQPAACDCPVCRALSDSKRLGRRDSVLPKRMYLLVDALREQSPQTRQAVIDALPLRIQEPHLSGSDRDDLKALLNAMQET